MPKFTGTNHLDYLTGTLSNDTIIAKRGDDRLRGDEGNDTIYGGRGADWLNGGPGDDVLYGGRGGDFLNGGGGNDLLYGGRGRDTFVFNTEPGEGISTIADFKRGKDTIGLSRDVFNLTFDRRDKDWFGTVITYDKQSGEIAYKGDVIGIVKGSPNLSESDFSVVIA